jgi:hypothetical protein
VKKNGRAMYEVKWNNYEEPTIEPKRAALMKHPKEIVKTYEKNMKLRCRITNNDIPILLH